MSQHKEVREAVWPVVQAAGIGVVLPAGHGQPRAIPLLVDALPEVLE